MTKALILTAVGAALIALSALGTATYPSVGYAVGSVLVLIGTCVLARKWPKPESDAADVENQINLQR